MNTKIFSAFLKLLSIILTTTIIMACSAKNSDKDEYQGKGADDIYQSAQNNLKESRYNQAIKDLEALEARFPYGKYSDSAQLGLIYAYFKKGDYSASLSEADRFIKVNPSHKDVDYAYYIKGMSHYEENFSLAFKYLPIDKSKRDTTEAKLAFDAFKRLIVRFPHSKYAEDSRQRLILLKEQLAQHELYIAKQYMDKQAYLAAANRGNFIVNEYDKTTVIPEALSIMITAYNKLGMDQLANQTLEILKKNYPASKELKNLL